MIDHVQGLQDEFDRVRAAIDDLDVHVPSCPDWRVRDLVHHLGGVYRLFRRVAVDGWMERPPAPENDDCPAADDDAIVAWTGRQADELLRALEVLDPHAPRWNFSPGPQVGAFIPRRVHLETVVHRWDLEDAYGRPGPIGDEVAVDGIREYLEVHVARHGRWQGPPFRLHTAVANGPTLELDLVPDTLPAVHEPPRSRPDAVMAGTAEPVFLAWWGRAPLADLLRDGDVTRLAEVRRFART